MSEEKLTLEGVVEEIVYKNEENGYVVFDLGTSDNDIVTVQACAPFLSEGERVTVSGQYTFSPKYGRQFKAEECECLLPEGEEDILRYLSSRAVKGVGPIIARRIVDKFGSDTFDVMENHPDWLAGVQGISVKAAKEIGKSFVEQAGMRRTVMFFRGSFGPQTVLSIHRRYGNAGVDLIRKNPYRLCYEVEGIGFAKADGFAASLGFPADSPERIKAGIRHVLLSEGAGQGHTCLPQEKLLPRAAELLGTTEEEALASVDSLVAEGFCRRRTVDGTVMIFPQETDEAEKTVAERLLLLSRRCPAVSGEDSETFIRREEADGAIEYAPEQKEAIREALRYGVMILTGGPGTGKTTVVRALLHIFESMDLRVALCAPTGRAAKRLSEATNESATTVHRLLGVTPGKEGEYTYNEKNYLDKDAVIVDEVSMIDTFLCASLLRALKPGTRLVLIGDSDQLPSVGAGNVLHDLIASERFTAIRLNRIFRQAELSRIVTNAHLINKGEMPDLCNSRHGDFFFLPSETDEAAARTVCELCRTRLPDAYGETGRTGVQVISPMHKGVLGVDALNVRLQNALNPPDHGKKEMTVKGIVFRVGDRVMQTKNNYEPEWSDGETLHVAGGIFNGDIGKITRVLSDGRLEVTFDSGSAYYAGDEIDDLTHAYAVTVHKSQGSEYPIVILPLGNFPAQLCHRNLFYTAVTRASQMAILVGSEETVKKMVAACDSTARYTGLYERLRLSPEGADA